MAGKESKHWTEWTVPWQTIVGALFLALVGVYFAAKYYDGPTWNLEREETVFEQEEFIEFVEPEEEVSLIEQYRFSCQANTIISGSYAACRNNPSCGLSDDEMMVMYIAGKTAVIMCKKHEMLELFIGLNEEHQILEDLKNKPLDVLPDEPRDNGAVGNLRIDL